jgi:biopolymer transport protein ExbD
MAGWTDTDIDDGDDEGKIAQARVLTEDAELDLAPMIDCTFLLLIFFIVCSVPDVQHALDLPPARFGIAVSAKTATVITVAKSPNGPPTVYLADGRVGTPLPTNPDQQTAAIRAAVEQGLREGRTEVLIKAERGVLHHQVAQVAEAVSSVSGIRMNLAVTDAK